MNGQNIGDLHDELKGIDVLGLNPADKRKRKCEAIKAFAEMVFNAARETYPRFSHESDTEPLYENFQDYFNHS